jgi:hypothetical protein
MVQQLCEQGTLENVRLLRPAWQRPACTRFHTRAGDWRFCVLRDSDWPVAQWRR